MLIETMREKNMHIGAWWVLTATITSHPQRTRAVQDLLRRQGRVISYKVTDGKGESREFQGLTEYPRPEQESLALYIRMLYGDGIFYSREHDGMVWLLIVHKDMIIPGTDCLLSPQVFDILIEDKKRSEYKDLPVRELSQACAQDIQPHYQASQRRLKKRRYVLYGALVCLGLALMAIPAAFIAVL